MGTTFGVWLYVLGSLFYPLYFIITIEKYFKAVENPIVSFPLLRKIYATRKSTNLHSFIVTRCPCVVDCTDVTNFAFVRSIQ